MTGKVGVDLDVGYPEAVAKMEKTPPITAAKGEFQAWFRPAVALLLIVLSFITMAGLLLMTPPEDRAQFIMLVFGFVSGSCLAPVVQYVFGTSQGSASKQAVQGQILERVVK